VSSNVAKMTEATKRLYSISYELRWSSFGGDVRLHVYGKDHMIILTMLDLVF